MKRISYLILVTFLIFGYSCSNDDDNDAVENGINKEANLKPTGSSANDFLTANFHASLVIEINYVENLRPNAQTLLNVKQFLENRIHKPGGITIIENQIPTQLGSPFSITEIAAVENNFRTQYNNQNVLKLHMLFLNGNSDNDTSTGRTLGIAYRNTSCVLFESSIQEFSNAVNEPNRIDLETTVILHEICHLLGLVDLGSPMQNNHIDPAHGKHCNNSSCLMYWQTENNGVLNMMASGNVPQLDANCILDLQANGGK